MQYYVGIKERNKLQYHTHSSIRISNFRPTAHLLLLFTVTGDRCKVTTRIGKKPFELLDNTHHNILNELLHRLCSCTQQHY